MANEEEKHKKVVKMMERAETHWKWLEETLHLIYVDAMVHGYTHRLEEEELEKAKAGVQ